MDGALCVSQISRVSYAGVAYAHAIWCTDLGCLEVKTLAACMRPVNSLHLLHESGLVPPV